MTARRFLLAAAGAAATCAIAAGAAREMSPPLDRPAPEFLLPDIDGRPVALGAFRGHPVLLNFWATWCGPCRLELPDLQALWGANAGCVAVVGVAVNSGSRENVAAFVKDHGVGYPILIGDRQVITDYGVEVVPRSVLIDAYGREALHWEGAISRREVQAAIDALGRTSPRC